MGDNRLKYDRACPKCESTAIYIANNRQTACKACGSFFDTTAAIAPKLRAGHKKRYFVTCAIESQSVHTKALATVQAYCKYMDAELIIIPVSYLQGRRKDKRKPLFARAVMSLPAFKREEVQLCKTLRVRGTINVSPTNLTPLAGFALAGHGGSFIIGSPILQQVFFKSAKYTTPCQMVTTGAITKPRYTRSRAGALGDEHHALGGVIVEIGDKPSHFHLRHVGFEADGSFTDLHTKWTTDGPVKAKRCKALEFGDLHAAVRVKAIYDDQFKPGGLVALVNPENLIYQDALHGAAIHKYQNVFERISEKRSGTVQALDAELKETAYAIMLGPKDMKRHVIESNHDRWLDQYLRTRDMWVYGGDSELVADLYAAMMKSARAGKPKLAFAAFLNTHAPKVNTVPAQGSLVLAGVEHAFHGDKGLRGSRGSLAAFANIGAKVTFGHGHNPARLRGAMMVGTCSPLTGHNGPNDAQAHAHGLLYPNSHRTLVAFIKGKFRREDSLSKKLDAL